MYEMFHCEDPDSMRGGREMTRAARAASFIRMEIKARYPGILLRVHSKNYSMGDSVYIHYVPTEKDEARQLKEIELLAGRYEAGHFDGSTDTYTFDKPTDCVPRAKYVFVTKERSL